METVKNIKEWVETRLGWLFINGRKRTAWDTYLRNVYGYGLPPVDDIRDIAVTHVGPYGKMIANSKSGYRQRNPNNRVLFNGVIYVGPHTIWWGDIDLTIEDQQLQNLATALQSEVCVLSEGDAFWVGNKEYAAKRSRATTVYQPRTI